MKQNNYYSEYSESSAEVSSITDTNIAFAKSYLFMFLGTFITLIVGLFFSKILANFMIEGNTGGEIGFLIAFFVVMIVELIICSKINKEALVNNNFGKSLALFLVYSALTGFMFSFLFVYFDLSVLMQVFFGVSIYFMILSGITFVFRKKIHRAANFAFVGLIVLLIASLIMSLLSWFMYGSETFFTLYLGISILGIIVFSIITLVDIKSMYRLIDNSYNKNAASISAALCLYLDFMNIIIYILRILAITGNSRSRK